MAEETKEETKRIGVGIAGLDHWYAGIGAAEGLRTSTRGRLVAVAHRDEEKLREFAAERGIPAVSTDYRSIAQRDDVDLVITACTTAENVDLCIEAAKQGKPIISVKPFAMNMAEADRLVEVIRETGVLFFGFEAQQRLSPQSQMYKEWIKDGRIGRPISLTVIQRASLHGASMDWPGRRNDHTWWRDPRKVPAGAWIDHAIYQVDYLRWLLQDEVVRVSGVTRTLAHPELPKELEDFGVALLELGKGTVVTLEVTWTAPVGAGLTMTHIVGTEGQVVLDPTITGKLSVAGNQFEGPAHGGWTTFSPPSGRNFGGVVEHVLECIQTGRKPAATIDDARTNLAVCLAFYEAAREGKAVTLRHA